MAELPSTQRKPDRGIFEAPEAVDPKPLRCDDCQRFVSRATMRLVHEYGDYGSILSTEVYCPRCI